uniref:Thiamine diphosphokinase n=1 Tax=Syphacia muris TaxID=451379 RepID=A0A0N5AD14_9BILA
MFLRPLEYLFKQEKLAVLLLNHCERWPPLWFRLWNNSVYRVCTDGGANLLQQYVKEKNIKLPHMICGDFDSVTAENLQFFNSKGVTVQATQDQDFTDMCKALRIIAEEINTGRIKAESVIVLGGLSGRIDHTLSSFNSLLRFRTICDRPIFINDGFNLLTVLTEGITEIQFNGYLSKLTRITGFIPFCQKKTIVTSNGFKWNLKDVPLEFGGCISSSNEIVGDAVSINTSAPLIFTLELSSDSVQ